MGILGDIALWIVPFILFFTPLFAYYRGVAVYDEFIKGAKEGLVLGWKLLPFLIAMLCAISVFQAGGAMKILTMLLRPLCETIGIPEAVLPLGVMRPFSGSGSLGMTTALLQEFGADSFTGRLASVMQGSTETTFYVLTVYFGAVGIQKYRYALAVGLFGDIVAFFAAFFITVLFFL